MTVMPFRLQSLNVPNRVFIVLASALTHLWIANAAAAPRVELVTDLLDRFNPTNVQDTAATEIRRPGQAGGVKEDALFEHPLNTVRPARILYALDLPAIQTNELLLLAFDTAIADGVKWGEGADGVSFAVEVDGKRVWQKDRRECHWETHAIDLGDAAGRSVKVGLLTEARANTSYDWALWGNPRVLRFTRTRDLANDHPLEPAIPGHLLSSITSGAAAIRLPTFTNFVLRLKASNLKSNEWRFASHHADPKDTSFFAMDFNFPEARVLEWSWEPADALPLTNFWIGAYPPKPELLQVSSTRALVSSGEVVPLRFMVRNGGRGPLAQGDASVGVFANQIRILSTNVPKLLPGESWTAEWPWIFPVQGGDCRLLARLEFGGQIQERRQEVTVASPGNPTRIQSIENDFLKVEFVQEPDAIRYARVYARQTTNWVAVAVWTPLFRLHSVSPNESSGWHLAPDGVRVSHSDAEIREFIRDSDGVNWEAKLRVELESGRPLARLHYEWKASGKRLLDELLGPNLYVGDGTFGEAKTWGLFPGLEYLFGAERSSNPRDFAPPLDDRRTPHPNKVTIPLMAVTVGPNSSAATSPSRFFAPDSLKDRPPNEDSAFGILNLKSNITVGLIWDPLQKWDGVHAFPSPRFASPNFDEGMRNHRLALFLPSCPDFVPEDAKAATKPYELDAGRVLSLDATLLVSPGPSLVGIREWLRDRGGLPKANPWPRSFQRELDICREGFLNTVWDSTTEKWRHCLGWAPQHAPGFATLLWMDAHVAGAEGARNQSMARMNLAATHMLHEAGAGAFLSQANCHILQWEFPFLFGYMSDALASLEPQIEQLIGSQHSDGGWTYQPASPEQADLGQAGDAVLGTCANRAATLLRYARITGDPRALAAGEKALHFMEFFRLPRGGQTWECPMYEPDILAAAYAIRANLDGYRATGNRRWLHDATYWAETGVPFIYLWTLPNRPMMLGATIPVFGSTFYSHTWLGVPVQWCGLVYAYNVFHLAQELDQKAEALDGTSESPLSLALDFVSQDWRRIAELITVSATYQQFADGPRIGTFPDSISDFERPNPAFINPEDILLNVLALHGYDPDINTARIRRGDRALTVSSGAKIHRLQTSDRGVDFDLEELFNEPSHSLVVGMKPRTVKVDGLELERSATPLKREPGWCWDERQGRAFLTLRHSQSVVHVEMSK